MCDSGFSGNRRRQKTEKLTTVRWTAAPDMMRFNTIPSCAFILNLIL